MAKPEDFNAAFPGFSEMEKRFQAKSDSIWESLREQLPISWDASREMIRMLTASGFSEPKVRAIIHVSLTLARAIANEKEGEKWTT